MLLVPRHIVKQLPCPLHSAILRHSLFPPLPSPSDDHGPLLSSSCERFSLHQLEQATHSWSNTHFLGSGGFGTVYKGELPGSPNALLAIKRAKAISSNFQKEVSGGNCFYHFFAHSLAHALSLSLIPTLTHSLSCSLAHSLT